MPDGTFGYTNRKPQTRRTLNAHCKYIGQNVLTGLGFTYIQREAGTTFEKSLEVSTVTMSRNIEDGSIRMVLSRKFAFTVPEACAFLAQAIETSTLLDQAAPANILYVRIKKKLHCLTTYHNGASWVVSVWKCDKPTASTLPGDVWYTGTQLFVRGKLNAKRARFFSPPP